MNGNNNKWMNIELHNMHKPYRKIQTQGTFRFGVDNWKLVEDFLKKPNVIKQKQQQLF